MMRRRARSSTLLAPGLQGNFSPGLQGNFSSEAIFGLVWTCRAALFSTRQR